MDSIVAFTKSSHSDSWDTVGRLEGLVDDGASVVGLVDLMIPSPNGDDVEGIAVAG